MATLRQRRAREEFAEALADYIDARIHYAAADPEFRSPPSREADRLDEALDQLMEVV